MSTDLDIAKERLKQKGTVLAIVRNGQIILESQLRGVKGLLNAIKQHKEDMKGSSVADRIVGKAAALLFVYSGVVGVFAVTISEVGIQVLEDYKIPFEYEERVVQILNNEKLDICPFEKLTAKVFSPEEAYCRLEEYCNRK
jgi:hypothetical protein